MPVVSVVVCVYNGERYLRETMESALAQTYSDLEIVAVDDGSRDRSGEILGSFDDPRLRVVRQANAGAAAALATGIAAATGKYVALLDQDDVWDRENLESHVRALVANPGIDLTFSWFRIIGEDGSDSGLRTQRYRGTADFRTLLEDFVIGACSNVVIRASALRQTGGPDVSMPRYYDLDLCLRVALLRPRNVMAVERILISYRRHSNQITRDLSGMREEWRRVLGKMAGLAPGEFEAAGRQADSNMHRYFARLAYESGEFGLSLRLMSRGFWIFPDFFVRDRRNWQVLGAGLAGLALPGVVRERLERMAGYRRV